jgi:hypothetical protein
MKSVDNPQREERPGLFIGFDRQPLVFELSFQDLAVIPRSSGRLQVGRRYKVYILVH